jgi:Hg(II)-responsive transcriptional regulator
MTVGRLAKSVGVNIQTIRYYERQKLLPRPRRREAGYRQYGPSDVQRLRFILRAKAVGFTLKEISALLALRVDPQTGCRDVQSIAQEALHHIENRLRELERFQTALIELIRLCGGKGSASECPILELLEKNS